MPSIAVSPKRQDVWAITDAFTEHAEFDLDAV